MEHFNNIDSESYSNAVDVTPEMITAGTNVLGGIVGAVKKTDAQKDVKAVCGRKPFGFGKKYKAKKAKYEECVAGLRNPSPQSGSSNEPQPKPESEKSNTGLYVGIGVAVVLITTLIIFRKRIF